MADASGVDHYDYDPLNPVPTLGGQSLFLVNTGPAGSAKNSSSGPMSSCTPQTRFRKRST